MKIFKYHYVDDDNEPISEQLTPEEVDELLSRLVLSHRQSFAQRMGDSYFISVQPPPKNTGGYVSPGRIWKNQDLRDTVYPSKFILPKFPDPTDIMIKELASLVAEDIRRMFKL